MGGYGTSVPSARAWRVVARWSSALVSRLSAMRDRWATFDCYGTLIDWMGGIRTALASIWPEADAGQLLARYHEVEPGIQAGRGISYRQVMAEGLAAVAQAAGLVVPSGRASALGDSLPGWPVFPEVPAALRELRRRGWRLAILSNSDPDLLDASLSAIGVPVDLRVVASEIGSYKPASGHWEVFFARSGADPGPPCPRGSLTVPRCGAVCRGWASRVSGSTGRRRSQAYPWRPGSPTWRTSPRRLTGSCRPEPGLRCPASSRAYTASRTSNWRAQLYVSWAARRPRSPRARSPSCPSSSSCRMAEAMALGDVGSHTTPQPVAPHDGRHARQVRGHHRHPGGHRLPQLLGGHVLVVLGVRLVQHHHEVGRCRPLQQLDRRHRVDDVDLAGIGRPQRHRHVRVPTGLVAVLVAEAHDHQHRVGDLEDGVHRLLDAPVTHDQSLVEHDRCRGRDAQELPDTGPAWARAGPSGRDSCAPPGPRRGPGRAASSPAYGSLTWMTASAA